MSCCYPPYSNIDPNWSYSGLPPAISNSLYYESINVNLPIDELQVIIPFAMPRARATVVLIGNVYNPVDDPQLVIGYNVVATALNSITILLSAAPDSTNYYLKGYVQVI